MNEKLLLQDLVVLLAKRAEITQKEADQFYRELVQLILDCIYENDIVKIKDLGTFKLVSISSRESVDVNTGEKIEIPAHFRLNFSPDRSLKELVNKPFSHFESVVLDDDVSFQSDNEDPNYREAVEVDTLEEDEPEYEDIESLDDELLSLEFESNPTFHESLFSVESDETRTEDTLEAQEFGENKPLDQEEKIEEIPVSYDIETDYQLELPEDVSLDTPEMSSVSTISISEPPNKASFENVNIPENEDFDHSLSNYEKQSTFSEIKKRLPIIITCLAIAAFAIYHFAKLFDVTYDYEYYIGRTQNLTLTDTLPYLDERNAFNSKTVTDTATSVVTEDTQKTRVSTPISDSLRNRVVNAGSNKSAEPVQDIKIAPTDLDTLSTRLKLNNRFVKSGYRVSDRLQIKIVNKAELYLRDNSSRNKPESSN